MKRTIIRAGLMLIVLIVLPISMNCSGTKPQKQFADDEGYEQYKKLEEVTKKAVTNPLDERFDGRTKSQPFLVRWPEVGSDIEFAFEVTFGLQDVVTDAIQSGKITWVNRSKEAVKMQTSELSVNETLQYVFTTGKAVTAAPHPDTIYLFIQAKLIQQ